MFSYSCRFPVGIPAALPCPMSGYFAGTQMRKEAAESLGGHPELTALAQNVIAAFKDVFSELPQDVGCVFTLLCWPFFCLSPWFFESSTGLENALKNCSCTCFSILAPRQENVDGETLGNNSLGNRSRSPAQHQWEQLSCRDGKTHGSPELENGG